MTEGIRIDRKVEIEKDGVKIEEYEQVYHVFMKQEAFVSVENTSDKEIGTLIVREKNSGKTDTLHKLRPGKKTKMYFSFDSYYDKLEFEIIEVRKFGDYVIEK